MVGEDKIISVSLDGKIKVWAFVPAKTEFELQTELTNLLLSKLPDQNCMFNFCKVFVVQGTQTLWLGTRDGRLFVWNLGSL
jgi:hypothetical protein